jgi:N6-adenosine-specific RNA methylase IME4
VSFFFRPIEPHSLDIVSIDYPWEYKTWSSKGWAKAPQGQYECMPISEIEKTRPQDLLAPGGVAVFWCTWPMIAKQSMLIENCFGLEIKTGGAWSKRTRNGKLRLGPGKILRTVCEPWLIACKKGHKLRARGAARNLIETMAELEVPGLARQHSRKPDELYDLLTHLTPGWRRADIFTRETRDGWTSWGKEKSKFDAI